MPKKPLEALILSERSVTDGELIPRLLICRNDAQPSYVTPDHQSGKADKEEQNKSFRADPPGENDGKRSACPTMWKDGKSRFCDVCCEVWA